MEADSEQQFEPQEYQSLLLRHQWQQVYHVRFHKNDPLPASYTGGLIKWQANQVNLDMEHIFHAKSLKVQLAPLGVSNGDI